MQSWTFYPAFLATIISIVGWTYLARKEHDKQNPLTLSELAALKPSSLTYFRTVLWICGPLFAITVYFFITPRVTHGLLLILAWSLTIICEMLVGVFPAKGKTLQLHNVIGFIMGGSMLLLAYAFLPILHGAYLSVEIVFAILMSILALLTVLDREKFLLYELPFIFLSHFTILVAALVAR